MSFLPARGRHPPDTRIPVYYDRSVIVNKASVSRLKNWSTATSLCYLYRSTTLSRRLPNLLVPGAVVDPSSVFGPTGLDMVGGSRGQAARLAALHADDGNVPIAPLGAVEGDPSAVR